MDKEIIEKIKKNKEVTEIRETPKYILVSTNIPLGLIFRSDVSFKDNRKNYLSFKIKKDGYVIYSSSIRYFMPDVKYNSITGELKIDSNYKHVYINRGINYDRKIDFAVDMIKNILDNFNKRLENYI